MFLDFFPCCNIVNLVFRQHMEEGDYQVEYAKSGRARCRITGSAIPNKALRIGEVVEGDHGTYPRWMNFNDFENDYDACVAFRDSTGTLHGLSSLKPKDKDRFENNYNYCSHILELMRLKMATNYQFPPAHHP
jgi:hypothetical protein